MTAKFKVYTVKFKRYSNSVKDSISTVLAFTESEAVKIIKNNYSGAHNIRIKEGDFKPAHDGKLIEKRR